MKSARSQEGLQIVVLLLLVFVAQDQCSALDIYVSVDGGPQADGSLANPYGSLPDAVEAVRALRKEGNTEPAKIILREGRHQLNQTLVLGLEDGSPSDPNPVSLPKYGAGESLSPAYLTFAAYPRENPVLSAGVPVTGWKRLASAPAQLPARAAGKVWVADIPAGLDRFYTLYDGQGRLHRARGEGFLPTEDGNNRTLHFPEGALKNWDNLEDVEIQVRPSRAWVINMLPLASVDEAKGVAQTSVSATYGMGALPAYNEISHAVQLLSDGNGIYISGTGTGNTIRYNYLHHNQSPSLPAAIRCDDDQHETLIYGNVLYKNRGHAAAIASKGTNNIINNFIVAQAAVPRWGYISFEWAPVTGSKAQRNIIICHPEGGNAYAERQRRGSRGPGPKLVSTDMDSNLYYHPNDSNWMDEHLLKMHAVGNEKKSLFGDPLFVDPARGDFSFRPGSPALALGIEPLDTSKMGLLSKGKR